MVKCPNCNKELPDDSRFCPYCRSAIEAQELPVKVQTRCPVCNAPVEADAQFCTNCRSSLSAATAVPTVPPVPACPKCGARLPEDADFCTACGQPVSTLVTEPQTEHPERTAGVSSVGATASVETTEHVTIPHHSPPSEQEFFHISTTPARSSETPPSAETKVTAKGGSVLATPQERQKTPEVSTSSPLAPKKSLLKAWWVWVVAGAIVAGCGAYLIFRYLPGPVPASATVLVDNFTGDKSLSTGLWVINGPVGNAVGPNLTFPVGALVQPTLAFSSQSGLGIAGVTENGQVATIETTASFNAPFTVNASVMLTARDARGFGLIVSDASGQKGVGIVGGLGSAKGSAEIDYIAPEAGEGWKSQGVLDRSLQANTWYTLSLFGDTQGSATLTVRAGSQTVGETTVQAGKGPFHIILVQEGGSGAASDHGQVYWGSINEISGSRMVLTQPEEHPTPATAIGVSKERVQSKLRQEHPAAIIRPPRPVISAPPPIAPAPPTPPAEGRLTGTWQAYLQGISGSLRVSIHEAGDRVVGTVVGGTTSLTDYIPVGKMVFYGTYSPSTFTAQEICAHLHYTSPYWTPVVFKVIDDDHLQEDLAGGRGCGGFPILWERMK